MLQLASLLVYMSAGATIPAPAVHSVSVAPVVVVAESGPKFRIPFFGKKKRSKDSLAVNSSPLGLVDRRLRDLVSQQESWFVKEGRYSRNAYKAGVLRPGDSTAFAEVQVEVLYAGKIGWTAMATHSAAPGRSCVIYVGFRERLPLLPRTHESAKEALLEGIPACDEK